VQSVSGAWCDDALSVSRAGSGAKEWRGTGDGRRERSGGVRRACRASLADQRRRQAAAAAARCDTRWGDGCLRARDGRSGSPCCSGGWSKGSGRPGVGKMRLAASRSDQAPAPPADLAAAQAAKAN
jgi:hypothetical protein